MITRRTAPVAAALLALAAGCGRGTDADPEGRPASAELTITVGSIEVPVAKSATLRIGTDGVSATGFLGGSVEAGEAAAAALDAPSVRDRLLIPPPAGRTCTEIYGGPDVAHVTGAIEGAAVDASFDRANGCGIADWDLVASIIGPALWANGAAPDAAYGDAEHPITLPVARQFAVSLESNATTGYAWTIDLSAAPAVELLSERFVEPDTDLVGAPGHQVFELQGVAAATGTIELTYVRSFEPDADPADSRTIHVTITGA